MAELSQKFLAYHAANSHVWEAFERFALQAAHAGRRRIGTAMIYERMRWYSMIETNGDPYKINNNYKADYARLFNEKYPQFNEMFPTRERKVKCIQQSPEAVGAA